MRTTVRQKMTRLKRAALLGGLASAPCLWSGCEQRRDPTVGEADVAEAPVVAGLEGGPPTDTIPTADGGNAGEGPGQAPGHADTGTGGAGAHGGTGSRSETPGASAYMPGSGPRHSGSRAGGGSAPRNSGGWTVGGSGPRDSGSRAAGGSGAGRGGFGGGGSLTGGHSATGGDSLSSGNSVTGGGSSTGQGGSGSGRATGLRN
ncbi:hypothetical protein MVI01_00100 [Myxococcus virescens]|uniref:Lipoprotein n=1 Tax=Myxococcus virescens TaxID=83456 RepID=A0A511H3W9_9BACT|nr:hypothetical protein MVI01_00100 [Myxococcus virescens]